MPGSQVNASLRPETTEKRVKRSGRTIETRYASFSGKRNGDVIIRCSHKSGRRKDVICDPNITAQRNDFNELYTNLSVLPKWMVRSCRGLSCLSDLNGREGLRIHFF